MTVLEALSVAKTLVRVVQTPVRSSVAAEVNAPAEVETPGAVGVREAASVGRGVRVAVGGRIVGVSGWRMA